MENTTGVGIGRTLGNKLRKGESKKAQSGKMSLIHCRSKRETQRVSDLGKLLLATIGGGGGNSTSQKEKRLSTGKKKKGMRKGKKWPEIEAKWMSAENVGFSEHTSKRFLGKEGRGEISQREREANSREDGVDFSTRFFKGQSYRN